MYPALQELTFERESGAFTVLASNFYDVLKFRFHLSYRTVLETYSISFLTWSIFCI